MLALSKFILIVGVVVSIMLSGGSGIIANDSDLNSSNASESLLCQEVTKENISILLNLGQAYEAEFSKITGKIPNEMGIFQFDTMPKNPYMGYLFYEKSVPVGFCIINTCVNPMDIAEFYIIPSKRKQKLGMFFSHTIFKKYPGIWQVRQIQGADHAVNFWRRVITEYTSGNYKEEVVEDPDWGFVTKQTFSSSP